MFVCMRTPVLCTCERGRLPHWSLRTASTFELHFSIDFSPKKLACHLILLILLDQINRRHARRSPVHATIMHGPSRVVGIICAIILMYLALMLMNVN